jgi:hypothetical protein
MMIGTPPPPLAVFPEAFLAVPGVLASLPVTLAGMILDLDWLSHLGLVLGAVFFWYCAGWCVDSAHLDEGSVPLVVRWYLKAVIVLSVILFPLFVLGGLNLGVHSCMDGVPPYWVEVVSYGILMFWITIGSYFAWRGFRAAKASSSTFHV